MPSMPSYVLGAAPYLAAVNPSILISARRAGVQGRGCPGMIRGSERLIQRNQNPYAKESKRGARVVSGHLGHNLLGKLARSPNKSAYVVALRY